MRLILIFWCALELAARAAELGSRIDPDGIDHELLATAILKETNARRQSKGLAPLKHDAKAMEAARIQSEIMRNRGKIAHENPERPQHRTLELRIKAVGLKPRLAAENVATAFGLQYESGKPFYKERRRGQTVFTSTPGGPAIQRHTYGSFAKVLVDAWMSSKGHRENILLKDAQYLGSYCAPTRDAKSGMPIFYCTQVFYSPLSR